MLRAATRVPQSQFDFRYPASGDPVPWQLLDLDRDSCS